MTSATAASASSPKAKIEIVRRRPEDGPVLDQMYAEVFGWEAARRSRDRWRWQYEQNPHRPAEGPEIWVAKEEGRILGQYATMPVKLRVRDRVMRASWGMDVMVGGGLQRKGVGSRLFLYWDQHVEASLGLGLSPSSYALFQKLQWHDVGPVPCWTRILDPKPLLARRLGEGLARAASPLARGALSILFPVRKSNVTWPAEDPEVLPLRGSFDDRFDSFWERVAPGYDFITERRGPYLEWKYRKIPFVTYDIFEARRRDELCGYIVLRTTERNGVRLGLLVDWLAHPEDRVTLDALLDRAENWAREHEVARLQTFTFDRRLASRLEHKGFLRIGSPMQFCLRIHSDHVDDAFYRDTSRWHVTFGDSDQDRDP